MTQAITSAVKNTLSIAKVKATVIVTPSTISIEDISNKQDAEKLEQSFIKAGMISLGVDDMCELGMGNGYALTIKYN